MNLPGRCGIIRSSRPVLLRGGWASAFQCRDSVRESARSSAACMLAASIYEFGCGSARRLGDRLICARPANGHLGFGSLCSL